MDLGIKDRRAIVCASSKGLGRACAVALANEGVHVTLTARGADALKKTADEIRKANPSIMVTEIVGDITTPAGREAVLKACPDPDILINNAGGPPPGDFRNWTRDDWIKAVDANMLTPIELIKATSLVSLITLTELTFSGRQMVVTTGRSFQVWGLVLLIYFIMAYPLTLLVGRIERHAAKFR